MIHEMKISLTVQKQAYAIFFALILSLVRGVTYSNEIGIALEGPMAILAFTFCADTYVQEIVSKRSEVWHLCPMKKRIHFIYRRIVMQEMFLLAIAAASYGLFVLFQHPIINRMGEKEFKSEMCQFFVYLAAIAVTLVFWGLLSNLISCLFQNMWAGIGSCMALWIITDSSIGDRAFGAWNLFSYTFRKLENSSDFSWIYGKIVCICIGIMAVAVLPKVIKKRG